MKNEVYFYSVHCTGRYAAAMINCTISRNLVRCDAFIVYIPLVDIETRIFEAVAIRELVFAVEVQLVFEFTYERFR